MSSPDAPRFRIPLALIFLLLAVIVAVGSVATAVYLDRRAARFTPTPVAVVAAQKFTDVPVISAIPPTATPTNTPTDTPTPIPPTPTPTLTPTFTPVPPTLTSTRVPATRAPTAASTSAPVQVAQVGQTCVSVVGDSVAHGDAVFEVPGMGFFEAQLAPVSAFIQQQYRQAGNGKMVVYNRSASAVGISSGNHPSYFSTAEYAQLLKDDCEYTLIIPWINDLSSGSDPTSAAPNHIAALAGLVRNVLQTNAQAHILIVNYYQGAAAPFALRTFATGDTPPVINMFNQEIAAACAAGPLAFKQVRCIDANAIFAGSGQSYVIGQTSQSAFNAIIVPPLGSDGTSLTNAFFGANPSGQINGDGVHLSNGGKAVLAAYVVPLMP